MARTKFSVGTFNVRGLTSFTQKKLLNEDIEKLCVNVGCLQETKVKKEVNINIENYCLICFPKERFHYGNGFLIKSI